MCEPSASPRRRTAMEKVEVTVRSALNPVTTLRRFEVMAKAPVTVVIRSMRGSDSSTGFDPIDSALSEPRRFVSALALVSSRLD